MKILKGKLVEVNSNDLVNGVLHNTKVKEVGDNCFCNMPDLIKVSLPNATTFGSYCLSSNDALVTVSLPNATTFGSEGEFVIEPLETNKLY